MNTRKAIIGGAVLTLVLSTACAGAAGRGRTQTRRADPVLSDFDALAREYMKLHHAQSAGIPTAKSSVDVQTNQDSSDLLAARIRTARASARQGDIFTPPVATTFRQRLDSVLRGPDTADARAVIRDDAPAKFALRVNDSYPPGASLPTVPANVLAVLPVPPTGLEFRIVDRHLILLDVRANMIVDYLFDVMCATC